MGAEGYIWITKFKKNLADALQAAREETFASGKFFGADKHPASIEEAIGLGAESGTGISYRESRTLPYNGLVWRGS